MRYSDRGERRRQIRWTASWCTEGGDDASEVVPSEGLHQIEKRGAYDHSQGNEGDGDLG